MKKLWINDFVQGTISGGGNEPQPMHAMFKGFPHICHCSKVPV